MAIDSAISRMGISKVSLRHDDKAKQNKLNQDNKKKHKQDDEPGRQPALYQRGQTMGIVIDISV
ncbi:MAG: hypothetical protein HY847_05285 [Betaproteobacteria bacterium]|nr:hypothetical protein [Betaproteobacteria bacterium]